MFYAWRLNIQCLAEFGRPDQYRRTGSSPPDGYPHIGFPPLWICF